MRTTLMPAAVPKTRLWTGVIAATLLLAATNPRPSPAAPAADERPDAATRTYDIYDFFWYSAEDGDSNGGGKTREAASQEILSLITETIEPGSWEGPNAANAVKERDGRLTVTGSGQVHAALTSLLRQLRESTMVQGVSLECHFVLADEAFLKLHAPDALKRKEPGASVRGIGPFKARQIVEAARETPGVVVVPAPPVPLYSLPTSLLVGEERRLKLPQLGAAKGPGPAAAVDVSRPVGVSLSVQGVAGERHVTLDLMARSGTLDALAGAGGGAPPAFDETEGLFHGTFAVERSGAFLARAPLVRARLAGVREAGGAAGEDGATRAAVREVVREVAAAAQPDPPRHLLVVGTVRPMTRAEVTLLAGARVAQLLEERYGLADDAPAPPPRLPGPLGGLPLPPLQPPPLPPPPPAQPPSESTRVYDIRGLLLGSERGRDRAAARGKRLEHVLARVKAAVADDRVPLRELHGQLIITAMPPHYARINAVLDAMSAERLVEPE